MCKCYDPMAKRFKVKKGFKVPLCESSLILCFVKRVKRLALFSGSWVSYHSRLHLCTNVFGVGLESKGEVLTDFQV